MTFRRVSVICRHKRFSGKMLRPFAKAYVYCCRRYILYHNKWHPPDMGKQEIEGS
jgi:hypothetical protein